MYVLKYLQIAHIIKVTIITLEKYNVTAKLYQKTRHMTKFIKRLDKYNDELSSHGYSNVRPPTVGTENVTQQYGFPQLCSRLRSLLSHEQKSVS